MLNLRCDTVSARCHKLVRCLSTWERPRNWFINSNPRRPFRPNRKLTMYYDGPPGMMLDLVGPSANGVDLEWTHPYSDAHPYKYARTNPIKYSDPSGLKVTTEESCRCWAAKEAKSLGWLATLPNCP